MCIQSQKRWVAVNPNGIICGPCMEKESDTQHALVVGYIRTQRKIIDWKGIYDMGYRVIECWITPVENFTR